MLPEWILILSVLTIDILTKHIYNVFSLNPHSIITLFTKVLSLNSSLLQISDEIGLLLFLYKKHSFLPYLQLKYFT